jgi:hypothetical protein
MSKPNHSETSETSSSERNPAQRVLNIRIKAELHRALVLFGAENDLTHGQVVEVALTLLFEDAAEVGA